MGSLSSRWRCGWLRLQLLMLFFGKALGEGLFKDSPYIINLDNSTFPNAMGNTSWIVNFYSPWCPHCVRFAPEWRRISIQCATNAKYTIGAVDCVTNKETCKNANIKGYPTVREYIHGSKTNGTDLLRGKKLAKQIDGRCPKQSAPLASPPTTERTTKPHDDNAHSPLTTDPSTKPHDDNKQHTKPHDDNKQHQQKHQMLLPRRASRELRSMYADTLQNRIVDAAAAVVFSFEEVIFASKKTFTKPDQDGLKEYLNMLAGAFPLATGRTTMSSLKLALSLGEGPQQRDVPTKELEQKWNSWKQKGGAELLESIADVYEPGEGREANYRTCEGYTCALWRLFHALSLNCGLSRPFPTSLECFRGIHSFVSLFFNCDTCRSHFTGMYPRSYQSHFDRTQAASPKIHNNQVALWIWKAHNRVNKRLASEKTPKTDPNSALWPSQDACIRCRAAPQPHAQGGGSVSWREAVVSVYLHEQYCHPGDESGCQRLLRNTNDRSASWLPSADTLWYIAVGARVFLSFIVFAAFLGAVKYRKLVCFEMRRWIRGIVDAYCRSRTTRKMRNSPSWTAVQTSLVDPLQKASHNA